MALSPKKRALVVSDLTSGAMTTREVADKHGVGLGTVGRIASELKTEQNGTMPVTLAAKHELFQNALFDLMIATVNAVRAMAEVITDTAYIKENPDDAIKLMETVRESSDRVMGAINSTREE